MPQLHNALFACSGPVALHHNACTALSCLRSGESCWVLGADADAGAGAVAMHVRRDGAEGAVLDTAPASRETGLLSERNSPAVREGSIDGARGNMSDWNESD
jgi:hypothetical protein